MDYHNIISFIGIFIIMGFAWLFSTNRRLMNWRAIIWGIGIQLVFACFIFLVPAGTKAFLIVNNMVIKIMDCSMEGARFLFGPLAIPPGNGGVEGNTSLGFILAFQGLPTVIFFSSLVGVLYYIGFMPFLIRQFGSVFSYLMRISGAESLCASSNVFLGVESALLVRPHLEQMTRSELFTVLTAGMATIASSVLGFYVSLLQREFPSIAGHLISASLLSAPAAVVISKIMVPESESPSTLGVRVRPYYERESGIMDAIVNGAYAGLKLLIGIGTLLIAFLGLMALIDLFIGGAGNYINGWIHWKVDWSLKGFLGYLFYPVSIVLGIPFDDAVHTARLIGERLVLTEVKSYQDLAILLAQKTIKHPRSAIITAYALCGFAHVASMGIFVGGTSALAPSRRGDLAALGPRALVAATLACLMTGAVAGTFCSKQNILLNF
jgi:concentrative nucleoside transporter, CNT family